jgi:hypothetical protein
VEQSRCLKADNPSVDLGILRFMSNSRGHYCVHKGSPLNSALRQTKPVYTLRPYCLGLILTLTSHLRLEFQSDVLSFYFPAEILYAILLSVTHATCSASFTMLQAGRSRVRVPMSWNFFILPAALWPWGRLSL